MATNVLPFHQLKIYNLATRKMPRSIKSPGSQPSAKYKVMLWNWPLAIQQVNREYYNTRPLVR